LGGSSREYLAFIDANTPDEPKGKPAHRAAD
jgi:hypothetical protein